MRFSFLLTLSLAIGAASVFAQNTTNSTSSGNATEAYIYGYAPVAINRFRSQYVCIGVPLNFLASELEPSAPATPGYQPNVDTLYSIEWLSLRNGSAIFSLPDTTTGLRYHNFILLDAYSYVFPSSEILTDFGDLTVISASTGTSLLRSVDALKATKPAHTSSPTRDGMVLLTSLPSNLPLGTSSSSSAPNSMEPPTSPRQTRFNSNTASRPIVSLSRLSLHPNFPLPILATPLQTGRT